MLLPAAGAPVITLLTKRLGEDGRHKVLTCEAEGYPKPTITWSVNGTWVSTPPLSPSIIYDPSL